MLKFEKSFLTNHRLVCPISTRHEPPNRTKEFGLPSSDTHGYRTINSRVIREARGDSPRVHTPDHPSCGEPAEKGDLLSHLTVFTAYIRLIPSLSPVPHILHTYTYFVSFGFYRRSNAENRIQLFRQRAYPDLNQRK